MRILSVERIDALWGPGGTARLPVTLRKKMSFLLPDCFSPPPACSLEVCSNSYLSGQGLCSFSWLKAAQAWQGSVCWGPHSPHWPTICGWAAPALLFGFMEVQWGCRASLLQTAAASRSHFYSSCQGPQSLQWLLAPQSNWSFLPHSPGY